ncbi:MAG: hypothetical protein WC330_03765 [Candidatus Omnitrophota bacterium]|jgi:hypothetical protein
MDKEINKIIDSIAPFCAPLYFLAHRGADATQIKNNGTVSFINTGHRRLLVTAYHVWDAYLTKKEQNRELILAMGSGNASPTILLEGVRLIDGDSDRLDIAVLTFENIDLVPEGQKKFFQINSFPLVSPKNNDVVAFIGYPGQGRHPNQPEQGVFSAGILFVDLVTDVSDYNIYCVDIDNNRQSKMLKQDFETINDFGGVSGAPAYVNRNGNAELVGFMTRFGTNNITAVMARADYINNEGMIKRL